MTECPMCLDGRDLDTLQACEVCHGLGYVTPGFMCRCGRSASLEHDDGQRFCGRENCVKTA